MSNTEKVKKQFYSYLRDTINCVLADDRLILLSYFNARVGSVFEMERITW